jgi:hypothetical protein
VNSGGTLEEKHDLALAARVGKYPALRTALDFSQRAVATLQLAFNDSLGVPEEESPFVAVAGSVGRLEASSASDLDYMIVYPAEPTEGADAFRKQVEEVLEATPLKLADGSETRFGKSNPRGVFVGDINGKQLIDSIGMREEDYDRISRRLLLLLESRSLWNAPGFQGLRHRLVSEYAKDVADDASKEFVLLINDLIRYFRTICVNYHSVKGSEHGKWPIRNIKLRHSRVVMYGSLLFCIGELSKFEYGKGNAQPAGKIARLREYVELPPLERFVQLYLSNADDNLFRFLSLYNNFLAALADPAKREELASLEYSKRYESALFSQLKVNSDAFASEVMRFLEARRASWSSRFFEYLIL